MYVPGQACIASNRVLVQAGVYDKFARMVADATNKLVRTASYNKSILVLYHGWIDGWIDGWLVPLPLQVCGTVNSRTSIPISALDPSITPNIGPLIDHKALDKVSIPLTNYRPTSTCLPTCLSV